MVWQTYYKPENISCTIVCGNIATTALNQCFIIVSVNTVFSFCVLVHSFSVSEEPGNPVVTIAGGSYLAADDNGSVEPNKSSGANPEGSKLCGEQQCPDIVHSEPLTDRKSTFQAHAAKVHSKQEVWPLNLDINRCTLFCVYIHHLAMILIVPRLQAVGYIMDMCIYILSPSLVHIIPFSVYQPMCYVMEISCFML